MNDPEGENSPNEAESPSGVSRERKTSIDEDSESWEGKPLWRHDRDAKECFGCKSKFTLILRKHHCRGCGEVFCKRLFKISHANVWALQG